VTEVERGLAHYERGEYERALEVLRPLALGGDREAQYHVAEIFALGKGRAADYAEAVAWYRRSAELGHADAQRSLAEMLFRGLGAERDLSQATHWYHKAAEQGQASAQFMLGMIHEQFVVEERTAFSDATGQRYVLDFAEEAAPSPEEPDLLRAVEWYRRAAEQGHLKAQKRLAALYTLGLGIIAQDSREAIRWARAAAEQGDADAQFQLGALYRLGEGAPDEDQSEEAERWIERAAAQGQKAALRARKRGRRRRAFEGGLERFALPITVAYWGGGLLYAILSLL
jgi:TPR repeat protein